VINEEDRVGDVNGMKEESGGKKVDQEVMLGTRGDSCVTSCKNLVLRFVPPVVKGD